METWNRERVAAWLKARAGQWVRLTDRHTGLKVEGRSHGVEELDACSADFLEGEVDPEVPGVAVALVLHEHTLGVHVLVQGADARHPRCALPVSVPYTQLHLAAQGEDGVADPAQATDESTEPDEAYSPYELLFRDGG